MFKRINDSCINLQVQWLVHADCLHDIDVIKSVLAGISRLLSYGVRIVV